MRLHSACAVALVAVFALQVAQVVKGARHGPWMHDMLPEDGDMPEAAPVHGPRHFDADADEHGAYGSYIVIDHGYYSHGHYGGDYGYYSHGHYGGGYGYGYEPPHHHHHGYGHYLPVEHHHGGHHFEPGPKPDDEMPAQPKPVPAGGGDDEHEHGPHHGGMSAPTPSSSDSSTKDGAALDTANETPDFPAAPETLAPPNAPWPLESDPRDAVDDGAPPPDVDLFPPEPTSADAPPSRR